MLYNVVKGQTNIGGLCEPGTHSKPKEVDITNLGRGDVDAALVVDGHVETLIDVVGATQSEAHQAHGDRSSDLKPVICFDQSLKLLCQSNVFADVRAQTLLSIKAEHKPQLQGAETPAERDLPVPIVQRSLTKSQICYKIFTNNNVKNTVP